MIDEMNRLRADLEVLERYNQSIYLDDIKRVIRDKIARLEEAESDPWRDAKEFCDDYRGDKERFGIVTAYIEHLTAENARLEKRVKELENPDVSDPDTHTLGDFAVLKTAQEIIRYAMDRNPDRFDDIRICRRAIAAIADFVEKVRCLRGLKNQLPYRWGSLGRDTAHLLDLSFDVTESPADYDPDIVRPIADMQPPFEGPIVGIEPVLDPARVLATAVAMMRETGYKGNEMIYAMSHASKDAKPYRLKGGDDVG